MRSRFVKISLLFLILPLFLVGCTFPWEKSREAAPSPQSTSTDQGLIPTAETENSEMMKFAQASELKDFLLSHQPAIFLGRHVFGTDSADIAAIDGDLVYKISGNSVIIASLSSGSGGKIALRSRADGLVVSGTRLAVFGPDTDIAARDAGDSRGREGYYTYLKIFDVSNPAKPEELRSLSFEGSYSGSRLVGNYLYFFTSAAPAYSKGDPLPPRIFLDDREYKDCLEGEECLSPDVYYFDTAYEGYDFLSVAAVNLVSASEKPAVQDYLLGPEQQAYASDKNIYLTSKRALNELDLKNELKREKVFAQLDAASQAEIKQIENLSSSILTGAEKRAKTAAIIDAYLAGLDAAAAQTITDDINISLNDKIKNRTADLEKTYIYRLALGNGQVAYQAKGEVSGSVFDSLSMNEESGNLRVATTRSELWSRLFEDAAKLYSNIYVLDDGLKETGKLENIPTNGRLADVRFLGSRAYLSTLKKSDPVYVVDFTDPAKPALTGAVTIPGFDTYIYPLDDQAGKIAGLGLSLSASSTVPVVDGLKLSLFDFSNLQAPKELGSYLIGDADVESPTLSDRRSLAFSPSQNIISLPVSLYDKGILTFAGALVFSTQDDTLKLAARIDHSASGRLPFPAVRSFFKGNSLITVSDKFLKITDLATFTESKSTVLRPGNDVYAAPQPIIPEQPAATSTEDLSAPEDNLPVETPPADNQPSGDASSTAPAI